MYLLKVVNELLTSLKSCFGLQCHSKFALRTNYFNKVTQLKSRINEVSAVKPVAQDLIA